MKIQSKLLLSFLALSLPFLVATNLFFYVNEKKALTHNILNHLESVASIQQQRLHEITEQNLERLKLVRSRTQLRISLDQFLISNDERHQLIMNRILVNAKDSLPAFKHIFVYSPDGVIVASSDPTWIGGKDLHEDFFVRSKDGNKIDLFYLDANGKLSLSLAGPLYLENKFLGVLLLETNVDNIVSAIGDYTGLGQSGETILATRNKTGDTVFITPTRFDPQAPLRFTLSRDNVKIPINRAFSGKGELLTDMVDYRNVPVLAATRYIKDIDWGVVVKIDKEEAFAPLIKVRTQFFSILAGTICFIILLSMYLAKTITRPIVKLTKVANNIAGKNFAEQADESLNNEIGQLATAFNKMTGTWLKTQSQLQESKKEWEETFDAMTDIVTIQNKDMRIIRANRAAYEVFHLNPGELEGKYCYEVFNDSNQPCRNCPEKTTIEDGYTHSENIEHEKLGKIFNVTSYPIFDEGSHFTRIVHIAKDITEHRKMEEELFHAHKIEAIGTLAGGIAHDFNNILAAILGYADLAKMELPDGSQSEKYIEQIFKAGNRAKELVKQILTFSRKGQEMQHIFKPSPIVKEALKLIRASLPTTIEIREEIDSKCGSILGNPTNIHQILINLCTNALHAMENGTGVLTVKLTRVELNKESAVINEAGVAEGPFVELMISDTGCGMDKKTVQRIFDPFFTTKEIDKGTGMGLPLVHGIVQGCGGYIKVDSAPGKGSSFYLYFPVSMEKIEDFTEEKDGPFPRGNERILVVDDEEAITEIYKKTLGELGYRVIAYNSSVKALEAFRSSPNIFDLVITDQTMPDLPGVELAKEILRINPNIPIILCTGYSSIVSEEKIKEIGIERLTMKPISRKDLAITVREVVDKRNIKAV